MLLAIQITYQNDPEKREAAMWTLLAIITKFSSLEKEYVRVSMRLY